MKKYLAVRRRFNSEGFYDGTFEVMDVYSSNPRSALTHANLKLEYKGESWDAWQLARPEGSIDYAGPRPEKLMEAIKRSMSENPEIELEFPESYIVERQWYFDGVDPKRSEKEVTRVVCPSLVRN